MVTDDSATIDSATVVEQLYQRHAAELTRFATSLVGPSDAVDLVSVAFVGAMKSGALERAEQPRAYLYRCVLNAAHSTSRSAQRRSRRERAVAPPDVARPAAESDPEVWAALTDLSDRQRAVVFLTYWLDMTPDAIAELLDLSVGAVKKHLVRGRQALRSSLEGTR